MTPKQKSWPQAAVENNAAGGTGVKGGGGNHTPPRELVQILLRSSIRRTNGRGGYSSPNAKVGR